MTEPLRPMNLGEILDRTFEIYRSRFLVFVGIAAVPALTMMALELANQLWWKVLPDPFGRTVFLWFRPQQLLYGLVLANGRVFFNLLVWPAFALVTSRALFGGDSSFSGSLSVGLARLRRWIGLASLNWVLQLLLPEVVITGLLIGATLLMFEVFKMDRDDPLHLGPMMFAASLVFGWVAFQRVGAAFSMSVPVCVIEDIRIRAALRRGRSLSRGSRWRLVFARVMPEAIGWILTVLLPLLVGLLLYEFLGRAAGLRFMDGLGIPGFEVFVEAAVAVLLGPVFPIALTLFYYDQRIRREGFDIELMMEAAGMSGAVDVAAESAGSERV